jgi:hypothetical protein
MANHAEGERRVGRIGYPHSVSTFPQSRKILAAKIAAGNTARVYNFDVAPLTVPA